MHPHFRYTVSQINSTLNHRRASILKISSRKHYNLSACNSDPFPMRDSFMSSDIRYNQPLRYSTALGNKHLCAILYLEIIIGKIPLAPVPLPFDTGKRQKVRLYTMVRGTVIVAIGRILNYSFLCPREAQRWLRITNRTAPNPDGYANATLFNICSRQQQARTTTALSLKVTHYPRRIIRSAIIHSSLEQFELLYRGCNAVDPYNRAHIAYSYVPCLW